MAATVLKLRLFLGSYAVLFGILAIRFQNPWLMGSCGLLALLGLVDNWRIANLVGHKEPESLKVEDVRDLGGEVAGYLATYLLPFVTVTEPSGRDLVGYGLFLLVTAVIYVRSEMVQINPAMYLIGRRVVSIWTSDGSHCYLITRNPLRSGDMVDAVPLRGDDVRVEVDREEI